MAGIYSMICMLLFTLDGRVNSQALSWRGGGGGGRGGGPPVSIVVIIVGCNLEGGCLRNG